MTFGSIIRARRAERGLTLEDVAAELEISIGYLSRVERDRERPPVDDLVQRMAAHLAIDSDELFAEARRLPPDLQPRAREVFAAYRRLPR